MKAELSYREIEKLIRDKAEKNVRVSYENSKTIKVSYDIDMFFTTKTVEVYLEVRQVSPASIKLRYYSYGFAIETIVSGILNMMDSDIYSKGDENMVTVYLENIEGLESAFKTISLIDIAFTSNGASVVMRIK
ncbi:MAG: hypothetical protein KBT20_07660 [Bacteroidales bacterium]|nr:hypothetical protein [Candidatus Liminaster caballi]